MLFKTFDFLSPPITFYYKGSLSHSSIFSGILSIFSFLLILIAAIYFFLDIIQKQNPTTFYFNSFVTDSEIFPINASSFFHFISLDFEVEDLSKKGVDFTSFRIIGFNTYFQIYYEQKNLNNLDHWLYGFCNNESDTQGIGYLVNYDFFKKSACIRKYFNSTEQKYYDTGDPKFKWPVIAHGTYHPDNIFYTIVIEKCKEDTINIILGEGSQCKSDDELNDFFSYNGAAHLFYIDNYINVLNYKNPITKFFNIIDNSIQLDNYITNHLNFNPSLIKTNNGLIFDNIKKELSYVYERNDVIVYSNDNHDIFTVYYIWLKNRMNYYERTYKRIQEVFSDIGGIFQVIFIIAKIINLLYNKYIILSDIENLVYSLIKYEKHFFNKNKIQTLNSNFKISNLRKSCKNIKNNSERVEFNIEKSKNILCKEKINNTSKINELSITNYKDIKEKYPKLEKIDNKDKKMELISNNNNKNFWSFILFKLSKDKKNNSFQIYNDFRMKIISEEHIIRNHLSIYYLIKINERKRHYKKKFEYKLKDIINLI